MTESTLVYPDNAWSPDGFTPAVWAPNAGEVHLAIGEGDRRHPMTAAEDGWWRCDHRLPDGARYGFSVDGGEVRPDPRSAFQPGGVHAMSQACDPDAHEWRDAGWRGRDARGAIVYELHVGTFTKAGTLDAAIDRLPHLVELGVDLVELMPLAAFAGERGWGYDGVALYAVHRAYGGPSALKRFVDAAHAAGLGVCLDVVYNHLGPSGNYLGVYGPYFTDRHDTPWGAAVNLDGDDAHGVRAFIIDNALRWFEHFHIDALRLDAVHALIDDSPVHLLAELSERTSALADRLGRPLSLIAESDQNDARMVTPVGEGGLGMTAQWADDVHHAVRAFLTGERHGWLVDFGSVRTLSKVMTHVFEHDGGYSTFRGRDWGRPVPRDTDARRFVAFGTTHDQVGNRAAGDRPSALLDPDALAAMHALILFAPFTPMLFMGEEWGARTPWQFFTDHQEPELARAIREGRRREFADAVADASIDVPDPQALATFERSRLDWSERDAEPGASLLAWVRQLIAMRKREPDLQDHSLQSLRFSASPNDDALLIERGALQLHIARVAMTLNLPDNTLVAGWNWPSQRSAKGSIAVPAGAIAVLRTT